MRKPDPNTEPVFRQIITLTQEVIELAIALKYPFKLSVPFLLEIRQHVFSKRHAILTGNIKISYDKA
jgi:hypothetical protein